MSKKHKSSKKGRKKVGLTPEERAILYVARKEAISRVNNTDVEEECGSLEKWTPRMHSRLKNTDIEITNKYYRNLEKRFPFIKSREEVLNLNTIITDIKLVESLVSSADSEYVEYLKSLSPFNAWKSSIPPLPEGAIRLGINGEWMYIEWRITDIDLNDSVCSVDLYVYLCSNPSGARKTFDQKVVWMFEAKIATVISMSDHTAINVAIDKDSSIFHDKITGLLSKKDLGWSNFEWSVWKNSRGRFIKEMYSLFTKSAETCMEESHSRIFFSIINYLNYKLYTDYYSKNTFSERIKKFMSPTKESYEDRQVIDFGDISLSTDTKPQILRSSGIHVLYKEVKKQKKDNVSHKPEWALPSFAEREFLPWLK